MLDDGEYVMDSELVSLLGDGDNDVGARRLDDPIPQRRFQQDHGNNNVIVPQC